MNEVENRNRYKQAVKDVQNFENKVLRKFPQIELKVKHYFAKGSYARELFIPKDVVLTGKIHKFSQINIMTKGNMSVLTQDGVKRVQAPFVIVSPAGTKRIAYAHSDTIWITIHGTDETDLGKIEHHFIAQNEQEYLEFCGQQDNQLELPFDLKGTRQCLMTDTVAKG